MREEADSSIAILIPSYDRPEMLEITLPSWLKSDGARKAFIVAQASSKSILEKYENVIEKYKKNDRIVCKLILKRLGSVKARNALLEMVSEHDCNYTIMIEDDMLLLDKKSLIIMVSELELDDQIGLVGGKVIVNKRRIDPDFFLNLPLNLADLLSRLTGYIFLDVKHGPRHSEYLPHFFMIKKEVLDKGVRYDEIFNTPTGFREESDFQLQIKYLGYKLLYDPRIYVIHLVAEGGGNRPKMSMGERMYWKARNHTVFILKWNKLVLKRVLYIMFCILTLSLYRIWHAPWIFKGVKDGTKNYYMRLARNQLRTSYTVQV